jgi:DNA-binding Lrp family transcriptional regulator
MIAAVETAPTAPGQLDHVDRALVQATQGGLPLDHDPYGVIAEAVGIARNEAMARLRRMLARGVIRRIGAVPNHYALGYKANGMSVWDVDDNRINDLGRQVGALDFVSHCYRRPRRLPLWPYNLFAMVHGHDRGAVEAQAAEIKALLGNAVKAHEMLYSSRILKKTGLRLGATNGKARTCSD